VSTVNASAISRLLRREGFMPSQPSKCDPYPSLQVQQRGDRVVVNVRHRGTLRPSDICSVLHAADYTTESDHGHLAGVDDWTTVWVWR